MRMNCSLNLEESYNLNYLLDLVFCTEARFVRRSSGVVYSIDGGLLIVYGNVICVSSAMCT